MQFIMQIANPIATAKPSDFINSTIAVCGHSGATLLTTLLCRQATGCQPASPKLPAYRTVHTRMRWRAQSQPVNRRQAAYLGEFWWR